MKDNYMNVWWTARVEEKIMQVVCFRIRTH